MNIEEQIKLSLRQLVESSDFQNQRQIDGILDRIHKNGLSGLTPMERQALKDAATGPQKLPELKRAGLHLLGWFKKPLKSKIVDKPDGSAAQGVKCQERDLALAIIHYKPEGHVAMSFNTEVWDKLKRILEVNDNEVTEGIQQWASRELALRVELENIYKVRYIRR